jgi:hypothetical protein
MRKIVYTCDRCDAEIEGAPGVICVMERDGNGAECRTDAAEVAAFFTSPSEREAVEDALASGWDLCAECVTAVLRTLIRKDAPRAVVKGPLPEAPKQRRGRKKKEDSNENHSNI